MPRSVPLKTAAAPPIEVAMERGLYIAASGMAAELARQDQIANDLANAATPGYKADRSTQRQFGELLLTNMQTGQRIGSQGLGVAIDRTTTDLTPGAIKDTGRPTDLAVEGDAFFVVQTPDGERYTRNGQFTRNAQGQLTTADGNPVLGTGGPVAVRPDGTVDPAQVRLVTLTNAVKTGANLFTGNAGPAQGSAVRAGALEGSGTNPARAMVDLIASMRSFEAVQRAITTIDSSLQQSASKVAAIS